MSETDGKLLYQYTNIEALASILENHTIRFNSLDKMDDLQEQMSADLKNAAKFVFISSWTKAQDELIPMWKLYTSLKKGVRIGLPFCPFEKHPPTKAEAGQIMYNNDFKGKDCLIPISEMAQKNFTVLRQSMEKLFTKWSIQTIKNYCIPNYKIRKTEK